MDKTTEYYILITTLIILFLIPLFWFLQIDGFLYIHDGNMVPVLKGENKLYAYIWDKNTLGMLNLFSPMPLINWLPYYSLINIGLSARLAQIIIFGIIFPAPFLSFFISVSKFNKSFSFWSKYIGAILYSLNLYLTIMWHTGSYHASVYLPYILSPIILYVNYSILMKKDYKFWKILLLSALISLSLLNHAYSLAYVIIPNFVLILIYIKNLLNKIVIKNYILLGTFTLLLSMWWIIPLSTIYNNMFQNRLINASQNEITRSLVKSNMLTQLKLHNSWAFGQQWNGRYFMSFSENYLDASFLTLIWILLLIVIIPSALYKVFTSKENRKLILFSLILLLVSLFLGKGSGPPLGGLSSYITQDIPILNLLRNPDTKMGAPIVLSIALLLTMSFDYVVKKIKLDKYSTLISLIILTFIIAYSYPLVTGVAVIEKRQGLHHTRAVGDLSEYQDTIQYLKNTDNTLNVFQNPPFIINTWTLEDGTGYWGTDLIMRATDKPYILGIASENRGYIQTSEVLKNFLENPSHEFMNVLKIDNLIFRYDIEPNTRIPGTGYYENKFQELLTSDKMNEVDNNNERIRIYENLSASSESLITTAKNLSYYNGDSYNFVNNNLIKETINETPFIYDFNNSQEVDENGYIVLSGILITPKNIDLVSNNDALHDCNKGFYCYVIYSPKESEYTIDKENIGFYQELSINGQPILLDEDNSAFLQKGENIAKIIPKNNAETIVDSVNLELNNPLEYTINGPFLVPFVIQLQSKSPTPIQLNIETVNADYNSIPTPSNEIPLKKNSQNGVLNASEGWVDFKIQSNPDPTLESIKFTFNIPSAIQGNTAPSGIRNFQIIKNVTPNLVLQKGNLQFGEKELINAMRVNPTRYEASLEEFNDKDLNYINFYQSYDNNWIVFVQNTSRLGFLDKLPLKMSQSISNILLRKPYYKEISENHFMVDGFANGWSVNKSNLDPNNFDKFVIENKLQRKIYLGYLISILTVIFILMILFISFIKSKPKIISFSDYIKNLRSNISESKD